MLDRAGLVKARKEGPEACTPCAAGFAPVDEFVRLLEPRLGSSKKRSKEETSTTLRSHDENLPNRDRHRGGSRRVFDCFVRPELLVRWMGDFAKLEAREGGIFAVDINGVIIRGTFVKVERPSLIEIAWGEAGNDEMPPGCTRLVVRFTARGDGTLVELEHSGLSPSEVAKHAIGWPHFLDRLWVVVAAAILGPIPGRRAPG